MNKKELIERVSEQTGIQQYSIEGAFDGIIAVISEEIKAGNSISISGFGNFSSKFIPGKTKTHNITKEIIEVAPKIDPRFKFSSAYKDRLNGVSKKNKK
ncbi:HU family DNA-binding protein [Metamycoplasma neophronis]|uniref:HU family DNA-binding protein n=1 Tax=Metamycoplasma neophronis TaxID=872983 RepID=A0ABY2Z0M1_9BACT|nr:HU family DNA-binding protein [Metamycoplasma neophronis]TPR54111.1 HU family DNA-binding protein [Metamycoplasma neophronis]